MDTLLHVVIQGPRPSSSHSEAETMEEREYRKSYRRMLGVSDVIHHFCPYTIGQSLFMYLYARQGSWKGSVTVWKKTEMGFCEPRIFHDEEMGKEKNKE